MSLHRRSSLFLASICPDSSSVAYLEHFATNLHTKQHHTEDVVLAAFLIPVKSQEHPNICSIFIDLTNLEIISRQDIFVNNTQAYYRPTETWEQVPRPSGCAIPQSDRPVNGEPSPAASPRQDRMNVKCPLLME